MPTSLFKSREYQSLLHGLKQRIQEAQVRAGLAVNRELVLLYWSIGREILARQQKQGWGAKVIDALARDLRRAFPAMQGLLLEISSTCERSPRRGLTRQLCSRLLHKFRGSTVVCSWKAQ